MSEHPCDGPWLSLDDMLATCAPKDVGPFLEAAADWGLTGIMACTDGLLAYPMALPESLGVLEIQDVGSSGDPTQSQATGSGADLVALRPGRDQERAAVLDLRGTGPLHSTAIVPWPDLTAVLLPRADEDTLDALSRFEDLAVFVPGDEFASGYRLGAASHFGVLTALHPWAAVQASELVSEDLPLALDLERRLQRFLETDVAPRLRRLGLGLEDRDTLLVEVLGWCPVERPRLAPGDAESLADSLRMDLAELFRDAP